MNSLSVPLPFLSARKMHDPFNKAVITYEFRVDTREIPDLPIEANARPSDAGMNRRVYHSVRNAALDGSLDLDEDASAGLFGYKHLGINIIAEAVEEIDSRKAILHFKGGQGVMNGGHGLAILRELQQDPGIAEMPPNFIKVSVVVGLPDNVIPEVAGANNTSVQVKAASLLELRHAFEPLKKALVGTRMENNVQWREGEQGANKVEDLVAVMTCFRSDEFPPDDHRRAPYEAYAAKTVVLDWFRKDLKGYHSMAPRLRELLEFQDYVRTQPKKAYNEIGGKFGSLKFVDSIYTKPSGEKRKKPLPPFEMPFTGEAVEHRLNVAAVYPILSAFRMLLKRDGDRFEWVVPFDQVKALWDAISVEVVDTTKTACQNDGYSLTSLGKDRSHWQNVQRILKLAVMQRQLDASRAEVAATKT